MPSEVDHNIDDKFDIFYVIHEIFKKKWIIILILSVSILLGGLLYAIYPKSFKGTLKIQPLNEQDTYKYIVLNNLFEILSSKDGKDDTNSNKTISSQYLANYFINKFNSKSELRDNIIKYSDDILNRGDYSSMDEKEYSYSNSLNYEIKTYKKNDSKEYLLEFNSPNQEEAKTIIFNTFKAIEENIRINLLKEVEAYKDIFIFNVKTENSLNRERDRTSIFYKLLEIDTFNNDTSNASIEDRIESIFNLLNDFDSKSLEIIDNVYKKILNEPLLNAPGNFKAMNYDINLVTFVSSTNLRLFLIISVIIGITISLIYILIIITAKFYKTKKFTD